jgi:hypothetical protein
MISIIDPDVVSHVLRPTVYRAAETQAESSGRPREPQRKSLESNREETPDLGARQLTART